MRSGFWLCTLLSISLLAATASADPFTGRYNIESLTDTSGVSISGYVDFLNAPMGTSAFSLGSSFVSAFHVQVSGPGISTLTIDNFLAGGSSEMTSFDVALGASVLTPLSPAAEVHIFLFASGDLGTGFPLVNHNFYLYTYLGEIRWYAYDESTSFAAHTVHTAAGAPSPAWRLVLASQPVPEPGAMAITGLLFVCAIGWMRRRRVA